MGSSQLAPWCVRFLSAALLSSCSGKNDEAIWGLSERRGYAPAAEIESHLTEGHGDDAVNMAVVVPVGVDRSRFAVFGQNEVEIGDGARVMRNRWQPATLTHSVGSLGPVTVGSGADVGSIYALGSEPVVLGARARVDGFIRARAVQSPVDVVVNEGVLQWERETGCDVFSWPVPFPASGGGAWRTIEHDNLARNLRPGAYERLTLGPGETTRLESGSYYFETLDVQRGGELVINNTVGPVFVWVRDRLSIAGTILDYWLIPNVLFGYAGEVPPNFTAAFRGLLVAPRAEVRLPATAMPHSGAFFARSVIVEAGAEVEHRAFFADASADGDLPCGLCASRARRAAIECCNELQDSALLARAGGAECFATCMGDINSPEACEGRCVGLGATLAYPDDAARACEQRAADSYANCQLSNGFRPITCDALGFPPPGRLVCAPAD